LITSIKFFSAYSAAETNSSESTYSIKQTGTIQVCIVTLPVKSIHLSLPSRLNFLPCFYHGTYKHDKVTCMKSYVFTSCKEKAVHS